VANSSLSVVGLAAGILLAAVAPAAVLDADENGMLGVLIPRFEVELEPSYEGQLVEVRVRIGDEVEQGSIVASLDDRPIRRALEEVEARLAQATAEEAAARTRLRIAQDALDRQAALLRKQAVSRETVRDAQSGVDLARAELDQSRAVVKQYQATVQEERARLSETQIRAPFAGTVAQRYGRLGMTVGPNQPVARLISSERLWARFAVPVNRSSELEINREVRIAIVEIGETLRGKIRHIGSEVDPASGMIICEAEVDTPEGWTGPPLAGQTVRIWIEATDK